MLGPEKIHKNLDNYDKDDLTATTICSHSSYQIFHGFKKEGFKTMGIVKSKEQQEIYEAYPGACPDKFMIVDEYKDILKQKNQDEIKKENGVMIIHGSFVAYVGADKILNELEIPAFGNRNSIVHESDRNKQRIWLQDYAGLKMPKEYEIDEITNLAIVKLHGAHGGRGFTRARNPDEVRKNLKYMVESGVISKEDSMGDITVQEYIDGARQYHHYFLTKLNNEIGGVPVEHNGEKIGKLVLCSVDRRDETNIDDIHRTGLNPEELKEVGIRPTYTVCGNIPLVVRESLLPKIYDMGKRTVKASAELFPPGINGPFCLETFCRPNLDYVTFEISGRIVAGTNFFINGSPYLDLIEPGLSTGKLIAREIKEGVKQDRLNKIIY